MTKQRIKIITEKKQIESGIRGLGQRFQNAQDLAQVLAVSIIAHAAEHGDCTLAPKLCRAVPKRMRNTLITWFSEYSPIGISLGKTVKDDKCRLLPNDNSRYNAFDVDGAKVNPWFEFSNSDVPEETVLDTFTDFRANVQKFIAQQMRRIEDEKVDPAVVADVQADIAALKATMVERTTAAPTPLNDTITEELTF